MKRKSLCNGVDNQTMNSLHQPSVKTYDSRINDSFVELTDSSDTRLKNLSITPEVIVQWIKDTLEDAAYFQVPGTVANADKRNIMRQYKIDRESLNISGIPEEAISRLYRCLFVYSIGFNEVLKTMLNHSKDKVELTSSIWKVFSVLLEYCCKVEYKAIINQQMEKHGQDILKINQQHDEEMKEFKEEINELKESLANLQKYTND